MSNLLDTALAHAAIIQLKAAIDTYTAAVELKATNALLQSSTGQNIGHDLKSQVEVYRKQLEKAIKNYASEEVRAAKKAKIPPPDQPALIIMHEPILPGAKAIIPRPRPVLDLSEDPLPGSKRKR